MAKYFQSTTPGRLLLEQIIPSDIPLPDKLDKKGLQSVLNQVAKKHTPDTYRDVVLKMTQLGADVATRSGFSIKLSDFDLPAEVAAEKKKLKDKLDLIVATTKDPTKRKEKILEEVAAAQDRLQTLTYEEAKKRGSNFTKQIESGARGKKGQLASILLGDLVLTDNAGRPIPIPVMSSYAEGLSPFEYYIASYGVRKGYLDVKLATREAGYLGKQLVTTGADLVIAENDCKTEKGLLKDLDSKVLGRFTAHKIGKYPAGTFLTPEILRDIQKSGKKSIIVRSPSTCQTHQGICTKCVGEFAGKLPEIGQNIGSDNNMSLSEPLTQMQIGSKHGGGVLSDTKQRSGGFQVFQQFVTSPQQFEDMATVSKEDGLIKKITIAPQGGRYIWVGEEQYYIPQGLRPVVKIGDRVEAGDALSEGIPNPAEVVRAKGIGLGRKYFMDKLMDILDVSGVNTDEKNLEILGRGIIRHVRVTDPSGYEGYLPDDIVTYETLMEKWKPRTNSKVVNLSAAKGKYLELPETYLTVGTRITPSVVKILKDHGIPKVTVNDEPPPFAPEFVRPMDFLAKHEEWMPRLAGFGLKKSFLEGVHRGRGTKLHGNVPYAGLAEAIHLGKRPDLGRY